MTRALLTLTVLAAGRLAYAQPLPPPPPPVGGASLPIATGSHAPVWEDTQTEYTTSTKEKLSITLRATDEDNDPLTYNVSGLPLKAKAEPGEGSVLITWETTESDVGVYHMTATVTDGTHKLTKDIKIIVEDEHESFFIPGVGYSFWAPNHPDRQLEGHPAGAEQHGLGYFNGARIEIVPVAWIHLNEKRGPSHGRVYVAFDILASTNADPHAAFIPVIGFQLSVERNPARRFLIPYFGMEGGVLFQLETDTLGILEPLLGVHLFAMQNIYISLTGGYLLPLSNERFDDTRGVKARFTVDFSLW